MKSLFFAGALALVCVPALADDARNLQLSDGHRHDDHASEGGAAYIGALLRKLTAATNESAQFEGKVASQAALLADKDAEIDRLKHTAPAAAPTPESPVSSESTKGDLPDLKAKLDGEHEAHLACLKRNETEIDRLRNQAEYLKSVLEHQKNTIVRGQSDIGEARAAIEALKLENEKLKAGTK